MMLNLSLCGAQAREARQRSTMGKLFGKSIHARNFGYDVNVYPPASPHRLLGWKWGGRRASRGGNVRAIFLGGKSHGSVAFGNARFLAGNHISEAAFVSS